MVTAGDSQGDPSTPSHIRSIFTPYDSIDLGVRVVWCDTGVLVAAGSVLFRNHLLGWLYTEPAAVPRM